jgi:hypothetical protein
MTVTHAVIRKAEQKTEKVRIDEENPFTSSVLPTIAETVIKTNNSFAHGRTRDETRNSITATERAAAEFPDITVITPSLMQDATIGGNETAQISRIFSI